jgi:hypothetical protein
VNKKSYVEAYFTYSVILYQSFSCVIVDRDILLCFLGTLKSLEKIDCERCHVYPYGTFRLPLDGCVVNFILGDLN